MGQEISKTHGGYIPFGLREPVVDNLLMVGDSAGMAPPTTSGGIRPAINFGRECAGIVQGIIDGNKMLKSRKCIWASKHHKSYVDVDDIIHAGVNDDRIRSNNNKIKRRCLSNAERRRSQKYI